jgi:hypothetical protein
VKRQPFAALQIIFSFSDPREGIQALAGYLREI